MRALLPLISVIPILGVAQTPDPSYVIQRAEVLPSTRPSGASRLLFAYVVSGSGFETEISISNTSLDTQGSMPQSGTCTLNFYGVGAAAQGTTVNISPGARIAFFLGRGGAGIPAAPAFSGYMFATCGFAGARGAARVYASAELLAWSTDAMDVTLPRTTTSPRYLLFPFVTNKNALDTGLVIANTSSDPYGTPPSSGTCTIGFYSSGTPVTSIVTPVIPGGARWVTTLSGSAPGFEGYAVASCNFSQPAGMMAYSDVGFRYFASGQNAELLPAARDTSATGLLFPAVKNDLNDTTLYITNTTADPLGTAHASGTCTLNFYGSNAPSPFTTPTIASGASYAASLGSIAPAFQGYVIASCGFPLARGWHLRRQPLVDEDGSMAEPLVTSRTTATPVRLLFASLSNRDGADAVLTISNTSSDPFGTSSANGTCAINYFGDMPNGGSPPSPQVSSNVPAGGQLTFSLSQGNPDSGIAGAPGFRGYVIADCGFPLARGEALKSNISARLTATLSHSGSFYQGQAGATYTARVSNTAGYAPSGGRVTATATIPAGLTLISMTGTGWTCNANVCTRDDSLAPNGSYPDITITVDVGAAAPAQVSAKVTISGGYSAPFISTDLTNISGPPPALAVAVTHINNFRQGQLNAAYTIVVSNNGVGPTSGMVTVTELMPAGLTLTAMSGAGWTCDGASCSRSDVLAPSAAYPTITARVDVAADAASPVTNQVSVSGGGSAPANASDPTEIGPPPAGLRFIPVYPCRVADTRSADGPFGGPRMGGGDARVFPIPDSACGIPSSAKAYSLNVAVVPAGPLGYLTAWPAGEVRPLASTLNSLDGRIKSNAAIVPAGAAGAISVFASNATHVIVDINGYFVGAAEPDGLAFYPTTPCRVSDTREAMGPLGGPRYTLGETRTVPIRSACGIPATARAYSMNFAVVPGGPLGYLTAWPTGQPRPNAANVNALTGAITANAAIVPAGADGSLDIFASDPTHLIIDINGYFAPPGPGGLSLYGVTPCRVADTRNPSGAAPITGLDANVGASPCGVPAAAQAHVMSATVVPPGPLGYLTMWPYGQARPLVSTLNALDGAVTSNMTIVPAASGRISAFASNPTHLILDVSAYFAP